ncbi:MAG: hypothetical protein JJ953_09900 [Gracilimonas sp.]|uniref:hypothetical protein n=1 Tax=Gracilimonas TaxID=649462 RepID=UPI001B28AEA5|nr:hypothetical protein [Gracilimonas sp.]MBO6586405.1 hypothetical protein [Gracilimonas sp.]MBO6615062.1 hypothetical protein [Gracilimonas sp.]
MKANLKKLAIIAGCIIFLQSISGNVIAQALVLHDVNGYQFTCNGVTYVTFDTHITIANNGGGVVAVKFTGVDTSCLGGNNKKATAVRTYVVPVLIEGVIYFSKPGTLVTTPNGKAIFRSQIAPGTVPMS